jgi:phospholipase/carboxylesterase
MMSLSVALSCPGTAAAGVCMSGRALPSVVAGITDRDALKGLPIFVAHGTLDSVLPIDHGRHTNQLLAELPVDLTYREYRMAHEISAESLRDITIWLKARLDGSVSIIG